MKKDCFTENPGGLEEFSFIPVGEVEEIPIVFQEQITDVITLASGKAWRTGYASPGQLGYEEPTQETAAGTTFNKSLKGVYPKVTPEASLNFENMRGTKFILKVKDRNGYTRIMGSLKAPAEFRYKNGSGDELATFNGYQYEFFLPDYCTSPFYTV